MSAWRSRCPGCCTDLPKPCKGRSRRGGKSSSKRSSMEASQRYFPKSAGVRSATTLENLELNTLWDGIFHSATYLFVVAGLFVLWRSAGAGD